MFPTMTKKMYGNSSFPSRMTLLLAGTRREVSAGLKEVPWPLNVGCIPQDEHGVGVLQEGADVQDALELQPRVGLVDADPNSC